MLTKALSGSRQWMQNPHISCRFGASKPLAATSSTRSFNSNHTPSLAEKWYSLLPQQAWLAETRRTITLPSESLRSFSVPQIQVQVLAPVIPSVEIEVSPEPIMEATSTLRKRKTKMNNHKRRKRLKKQRFLLRKLGKI